MLEAAIFDANGVLIELRESVGSLYARTAARHGVALPAWRLDDAFQRVLARSPAMHFPDLPRSEVPARERAWWGSVVRSTFLAADSTVRFPDPDAFFDELFALFRGAEAWRTRPAGLALARAAAAAGLRRAVASNFDHRLPVLLETLEIADLFEFILTPSEAGSAKPDARFFRGAAERLGLSPGACAYVGHDPELDLAAARRAGLLAVDVGDAGAAATLRRERS